jgi:uncharacterized OsmC-like protein
MSNANVRDAIERMGAAIAAEPAKAQAKNAPAVARLADGLRCEVSGPRSEHLVTDMAPAVGGTGSAPNPGWLFRAALASCTTTLIGMRAAALGVKLASAEVSVDSDSDLRGILGQDERISAAHSPLRIKVRISAPGVAEDTVRALVQWADAHSPVNCTVRERSAVSLEVEVT